MADQSTQKVPSLIAFISQTGEVPDKLTKIDYYPVIAKPITDYKTVQECLHYAEKATAEVGQKYVITTFDLGVCMKAYPLVWNNPMKYDNHIIMIGTFHGFLCLSEDDWQEDEKFWPLQYSHGGRLGCLRITGRSFVRQAL